MRSLPTIRTVLLIGLTCLGVALASIVLVSAWCRVGVALCIRDGYVVAIANGRFGAFDSQWVGVNTDYFTYPPTSRFDAAIAHVPKQPLVGVGTLDEIQGEFVLAVSEAEGWPTPQLWPAAALALALCAVFWWASFTRRPKRGCCRFCRYDLRGNVLSLCPECGRRPAS